MYTPPGNISSERLSRFDHFRAALSEDERIVLDHKLARWRNRLRDFQTGRGRHPNFGGLMVEELFMALIEFQEAV